MIARNADEPTACRVLWMLPLVGLFCACGIEVHRVASDPTPLPRHELVFAHHSDPGRSDYDVWRVCADGTQLASLVVAPGQQFQLSVAPDGEQFAYASDGDGQFDLYRQPFGRGEAVRLTDHPARDSSPAWSPDGRRIAFLSTRDAEKPEIYLLSLADGSIERLTDNEHHDSEVSWSPDGQRIAFTRYFPTNEERHEGAGEIFVIELETRHERQLTRLGGYNGGLSHSPDGHWIAFHRTYGGSEIWLMGADGSEPRAVTDTPVVDEYSPEWSPDGRWIAFSAGRESDNRGTFDLWLMRPDGSRRHVVSRLPNTEAWHKWRPGENLCR